MSNDVLYYKEPQPFFDSVAQTLLASPLSGIVSAINGLMPPAGTIKQISMNVVFFISADVYAQKLLVDISDYDVRVLNPDTSDSFLLTFDDFVGSTGGYVTALALAKGLAALGVVSANPGLISLGFIGTAGSVIWSGLSEVVQEVGQSFSGSIDQRYEIFSPDGSLVMGALYASPPDDVRDGVRDIIEKTVELALTDIVSGMTIQAQGEHFWGLFTEDQRTYTIYDGDIAVRAAEIFFGGNIEAFKAYGGGEDPDVQGNAALYTEFMAGEFLKRYLFATSEERIVLPGHDVGFNPSNIFIAKNGQIAAHSYSTETTNLWLGDSLERAGPAS